MDGVMIDLVWVAFSAALVFMIWEGGRAKREFLRRKKRERELKERQFPDIQR